MTRIPKTILAAYILFLAAFAGAQLQARYGLPRGPLCGEWNPGVYTIVDTGGTTYTVFAKHACQAVWIGLSRDGELSFVNVTHQDAR